jgi:DtxR family Mn-dependent transcriptional regulator
MAHETTEKQPRSHPRRRHLVSTDGPTEKEREYLEVIYYLNARDEPIIAARLARWMGVQPPTVTHIVRQMEEKQYITRNERGEIALTATGYPLAEGVVRRHRILERFLTDVLHMPWYLLHEEAVRLEHALSPTLMTYIEQAVGNVHTCPHGNPIPGSANPSYGGSTRLDAAPLHTVFTVRRVLEEAEEDMELMRYLQANELVPDSQFTIAETSPAYGVTLQRRHYTITVSPEIAAVLWGDIAPPLPKQED